MRKRLLAWSLMLAIFAACFPAASAASAEVRILSPDELPKAGEEFAVSAEISGNPGICSVQVTLVYDGSKIECTYIEEGELLSGAIAAKNPKAKPGASIAAASVDVIEEDGTIAIFGFTAKEDMEELDFQVELYLSDADGNDVAYSIAGAEEYKEEDTLPNVPVQPPVSSGSTPSGGGTSSGGGSSSGSGTSSGSSNTASGSAPEASAGAANPQVQLHQNPFPDAKGHWAESYIAKAYELGLFKGDAKGNFNPDANVTRAQFVTVLWRMAGSTAVSDATPFTDISNQIDEFKSAIAWGYANGYINGNTRTTFDPNGTLTREAGMKILHFYSGGQSGGELLLADVYNGTFKDSAGISDWARNSVYWGVYNELISGTSADTLSPQGTATRAQLAKILVSYIESYNK